MPAVGEWRLAKPKEHVVPIVPARLDVGNGRFLFGKKVGKHAFLPDGGKDAVIIGERDCRVRPQ